MEKWKNEEKCNYLVYKEKYSYALKEYCLKNRLGKIDDEGLLLHRDVAYIFMKYLAQEVAYKTNSSIITDSEGFEKYANSSHIETPATRELNSLAKSVIQLKLQLKSPQNISEIDFAKLIKFRQTNRELLKAFHKELEKIENNINNISSVDFLKQFDAIHSELVGKIILIGLGAIVVPFKIYSWFQGTANIQDIVEGVGSTISSGFSFKELYKQTYTKRQCVKYFANLKKLKTV